MTPERPVVSVVTANYNGAQRLPAAIASVLGQTLGALELGALELIVVDDGSSDDSVAIVREAAARDPRVRLIVQPQNAGPGAARNAAIAVARGRFAAIFDSDDLMEPDRLERLVRRAEADRADMAVDNLLAFDDADPADARPFLAPRAFAKARWITLAEVIASSRMYARTPGLGYVKPLVRMAALKTAGVRYDETLRIGEDYDFLIRLLGKGLRLRVEPAALYRYRRYAGSISHAMRRDDIEAMLRADAAFEADHPDLAPDARRALAARGRSLERALAYDEVIESLKAGRIGRGLTKGLGAPQLWPLLAMPLAARLRRLGVRRQGSAPAAQRAAA